LYERLGPGDDLNDAFAWKEERTLSRALTLQCDKVVFILETDRSGQGGDRQWVAVVDYPDGRLAIRYCGVEFAYRAFDKVQQVYQSAIADNKRLGAVLAMIRDQQLRREPEHRSDRAPRPAISRTPAFSRSAEPRLPLVKRVPIAAKERFRAPPACLE
jgi:hypothetical protein